MRLRLSCFYFLFGAFYYFTVTASSIQAQVRLINGVSVPADFPVINTQIHGNTSPGRLFFSSTFFDSDSRSNYLIICENDGTPYFYRKYTRGYLGCGAFTLQPDGRLSFYKYTHNDDGAYILMDPHFVETDTFRCAGDYWTDSHELVLLPNGHALLICEYDTTINMSQFISGGRTQVPVILNHIQEVDSDRHLYWKWNCWDRLDIRDTYENLNNNNIDYIHLNSIAVDYDGHYVISLRNFSEVAKINSETGDFIWRLGGKNNEFTFINESTLITRQHHAMPVPGNPDCYTIYDNGNDHNPPFTRAVEYRLNPADRTAEKVWEYQYGKAPYSYMMGSVQRLSDGHTYMDCSTWAPLRSCEVNADNDLVFEMEVQGISSYRSFRLEWDGIMQKPYLLIEAIPEGLRLLFNKFGDSQVREYQVYGGMTAAAEERMLVTSETYAEFTQLNNNTRYFFKVRAVDHSGGISAFSDVAEAVFYRSEPGTNFIINGDFSAGQSGWDFLAREGARASGSVTNGEYHVQITDGSTEYWHVQLIQESFPLVQGRKYLFEFDAKAETIRMMEPRVAQNGGNYAVYSKTSPVSLRTRMRHYQYEFIMTDPTDANARVVMNCGSSDADCYFDNISVTEVVESGLPDAGHFQPERLILSQNYPNPFNASTTLRFYLPASSQVTMALYDLTGKCVKPGILQKYTAGWHTRRFESGGLDSGVYICRIRSRTLQTQETISAAQKWVLIK